MQRTVLDRKNENQMDLAISTTLDTVRQIVDALTQTQTHAHTHAQTQTHTHTQTHANPYTYT